MASSGGVFNRGKQPQVHFLAVNHHTRPCFDACVKTGTTVSTPVIPTQSRILALLSLRDLAKVVWPVVASIPILMIDQAGEPLSVEHEPNQQCSR